jgi:hypothetical protein
MPGDDGYFGEKVKAIELYVSREPITQAKVDSGNCVDGYPYGCWSFGYMINNTSIWRHWIKEPGQLTRLQLDGTQWVPPGTPMYFAVSLIDEADNESKLSNIVRLHIHTEAEGDTYAPAAPYTPPCSVWPNQASPDLFSQRIYYEEPLSERNGLGGAPLYNGNISALAYQTPTDWKQKGYFFSYDGLNRLKSATYGAKSTSGWSNDYNFFSVTGNGGGITYDRNGNILSLNRRGLVRTDPYIQHHDIDRLTYTYQGNRLMAVADGGSYEATIPDGVDHFVDGASTTNEYLYDANGNIIKDLNKGISITYNRRSALGGPPQQAHRGNF